MARPRGTRGSGGPPNRPTAPPPKPSGSSSTAKATGEPPRTHRGWTRFNGTVATTLPSALRQARMLRNAAWRVR